MCADIEMQGGRVLNPKYPEKPAYCEIKIDRNTSHVLGAFSGSYTI